MKRIISNKSTNNKTLIYEENNWTGKRKISYDGQECIAIDKFTFTYTENQKENYINIGGNTLFGLKLKINSNDSITLVEKIEWYEYVMSAFFIILVVLGGAIGGGIGGIFFVCNIYLIKSFKKIYFKILITLVMLGVSFGIYYLIIGLL